MTTGPQESHLYEARETSLKEALARNVSDAGGRMGIVDDTGDCFFDGLTQLCPDKFPTIQSARDQAAREPKQFSYAMGVSRATVLRAPRVQRR